MSKREITPVHKMKKKAKAPNPMSILSKREKKADSTANVINPDQKQEFPQEKEIKSLKRIRKKRHKSSKKSQKAEKNTKTKINLITNLKKYTHVYL